MRFDVNRGAYWAKTYFSLKFCDGFLLPKGVPNMIVSERTALGGCVIGAGSSPAEPVYHRYRH